MWETFMGGSILGNAEKQNDEVQSMSDTAADLMIANAQIKTLEQQLSDARNELCQKCGRYREATRVPVMGADGRRTNMNTDETVKILRANANCEKFYKEHNDCCGCPMPYKENPSYQKMCVGFDGEVLPRVADLIEQQQDHIAELEKRLAESQRREQAAVEDINSMLDNVDSVICCHYCAKSKHGEYCGFDSEGENGELVHCPGEWRGPMNAERQIRHE